LLVISFARSLFGVSSTDIERDGWGPSVATAIVAVGFVTLIGVIGHYGIANKNLEQNPFIPVRIQRR
jgi:hypothetical protein